MNNEQQKAKELAELLTAFSDGKQLQYQVPIGYWVDYTNDTTTEIICTTNYPIRIKPETRRIALIQQDLIDRELSGKTMRAKYGYGYCIVTDYNENNVFLADEKLTYEEFSKLEWLDGTPCYKEVECE